MQVVLFFGIWMNLKIILINAILILRHEKNWHKPTWMIQRLFHKIKYLLRKKVWNTIYQLHGRLKLKHFVPVAKGYWCHYHDLFTIRWVCSSWKSTLQMKLLNPHTSFSLIESLRVCIYIYELSWLENPANTHMRNTEHWTAVLTLLGLISSAYHDFHHWRLNQQAQNAEAETLPLGHRFISHISGPVQI